MSSTRTQDAIDRYKSRLARIDWNIHDFTRGKENAAYLLKRSWWQVIRGSLAVLAVGVVLIGVGLTLWVAHIPGEPQVGFYFFGGALVLAAGLWLGGAVDERNKAPQELAYAINMIAKYEQEKLTVLADLERAEKRQQILSADTRWVGSQVKTLAAAAGMSEEDVARFENVFNAVAEDFTA